LTEYDEIKKHNIIFIEPVDIELYLDSKKADVKNQSTLASPLPTKSQSHIVIQERLASGATNGILRWKSVI